MNSHSFEEGSKSYLTVKCKFIYLEIIFYGNEKKSNICDWYHLFNYTKTTITFFCCLRALLAKLYVLNVIFYTKQPHQHTYTQKSNAKKFKFIFPSFCLMLAFEYKNLTKITTHENFEYLVGWTREIKVKCEVLLSNWLLLTGDK